MEGDADGHPLGEVDDGYGEQVARHHAFDVAENMRDAPAQAPVEAKLENGGSGLVAGGDEKIEAGEEDENLRDECRRQDGHAFDADTFVYGHGQAFAAGELAQLIAHALQRVERRLEFGQLQLQVRPELRQARKPERQRRGDRRCKKADRDDEQDHHQRGGNAGPQAASLELRSDRPQHEPEHDAEAGRRQDIFAGMEREDDRDQPHHDHRDLRAAQQEKLDIRLGRQPDDRCLLGNAIGHENIPAGTKSRKRPLTILCSRRNLAIHAALNARKRKE